MLLSFSVENFRLFTHRVTLDLVDPAMRTVRPRVGESWQQHVRPIAALLGPNASGKSSLLNAIILLSQAVHRSGTFLHAPSLASPELRESPTRYDVDIEVGGVRYRYVVDAHPWGIGFEELVSFPKGNERLLFRREQEGPNADLTLTKGPSLRGPTDGVKRLTTPVKLFLAVAQEYGHEGLADIAAALTPRRGLTHVSFEEFTSVEAANLLLSQILPETGTEIADADSELLLDLVRAADVGIERIEIDVLEVPAEVRERVQRILRAHAEPGDEGPKLEDLPSVQRVARFIHHGEGGSEFQLGLLEQSAGTRAWLVLAWNAVMALRRGTILIVDELDASLHPRLVRELVAPFLDPAQNPHGAQLIFTTHDATLIGTVPDRLLAPEHVWFLEKDADGAAELFSLAEFENRPRNNNERRYLLGAFGAVPLVETAALAQAVGLR